MHIGKKSSIKSSPNKNHSREKKTVPTCDTAALVSDLIFSACQGKELGANINAIALVIHMEVVYVYIYIYLIFLHIYQISLYMYSIVTAKTYDLPATLRDGFKERSKTWQA